jgi:hypothetical protein
VNKISLIGEGRLIFERYPLHKLITFLIWLPMFLLVRFVAGLITTPDWVSSFGVFEALLAAVLAIVIVQIGRRVVVGPEEEGHWSPGFLALLGVCGVGFMALSVWVGMFMHHADYPPPDLQAEHLREQMRAIERTMKDIDQRAGTGQSNAANPEVIRQLAAERQQALEREAAERQRRQTSPSATNPAVN